MRPRLLLGRGTRLNRKWTSSKRWLAVKYFGRFFYRGYEWAGHSYERQVTELCLGIFQEGWLAFLRKFGTLSNHLAWAAPAPLVELLDPPVAYLLILLLGFNEEEYATLSAEGKDGNAVVVEGNELVEVEGVVAERAKGVEAEGENLPEKYPVWTLLPIFVLDFGPFFCSYL